MPLTSLGRVSNSASRAFANAKGTIANINYGRIVGSYDNNDIAYATQRINSTPTNTINLAVTGLQQCKDFRGGVC